MRALVALAAAAVCKIVRRVNELAMSPPHLSGRRCQPPAVREITGHGEFIEATAKSTCCFAGR